MIYRRMPHRCIKCGARKTLSRLWSDYIRPPKCGSCGYYRLTPCRERLTYGAKHRCNCGGQWFPHRKGSKYCFEHPNAENDHIERREG